jgi:hypothetical protein
MKATRTHGRCFQLDARYWLSLGIAGLCLYSGIIGSRQIDTIPEVLDNPPAADGTELRLGSDVKLSGIQAHEFQVEQLGARIVVRVPAELKKAWAVWSEQLRVGDYVSMKATYHSEEKGYLLLHTLHPHKGRRLKIWVSLGALILVAGMMTRDWRKTSRNYA